MAESILVLMCTFRRAEVIAALDALGRLEAPEGTEVRIVVIDNDDTAAKRAEIEALPCPLPLTYLHAPARNISLARNAGLARARAEGASWVAFVDDDGIVPPDWLVELRACAAREGADVAFGPARAVYPTGAPGWMVALDAHSNPARLHEGRALQTAHTCNALLRWAGMAWADTRFDPGRGRSGGEDTAFFFEVSRRGARFAACTEAEVLEPVGAGRLSAGWLLRRRFRMGQSHVAGAQGWRARRALGLGALVKVSYCGLRGLLALPRVERRMFWLLRGSFHLGVVAGCLAVPDLELYGRKG